MNKQAIEYQQSVSSRMVDFCKPLNDYLGISLFTYFKAYKDGSYLLLSNDHKLVEDYISTVNSEIIYFQKHLHNKSKYQSVLWPEFPENDGMKAYFKNGYWHGLNIITQNDNDVVEGCGFVSHKDNPRINDFYIRNIDLLEKFANHFKRHFHDIITTESNQNLAKFSNGCSLHIPQKTIENDFKKIHDFLQKTGLNNSLSLSKRELQCLSFIDKGYSAKFIARELLISPKTIENHINNIKQKTGINYRHDLVSLYRELF